MESEVKIDKEKGEVLLSLTLYKEMLGDLRWLRALESAGVDNWQGIDYAIETYNEGHPDER